MNIADVFRFIFKPEKYKILRMIERGQIKVFDSYADSCIGRDGTGHLRNHKIPEKYFALEVLGKHLREPLGVYEVMVITDIIYYPKRIMGHQINFKRSGIYVEQKETYNDK